MSLSYLTKKTVLLAGNPNSGKSTLFNQLTGAHQKVANYPGVTVEKHLGFFKTPSGQCLTIVDLPGAYSLSPRSEDEKIAAQHITGLGDGKSRSDVVVVVAEAAKLPRALYLFLQIQKIHPQVVLAVNMMDELADFCMELDTKKLEQILKAPVIPMVAKVREGVPELIRHLERSRATRTEVKKNECVNFNPSANVIDEFKKADAIAAQVLKHKSRAIPRKTQKYDRILLHPLAGPAVFFAVMFLFFQALFSWSAPLMDVIDNGFVQLGRVVQGAVAVPWLASFLSDGVIAGVGSVLVFVPQITIVFLLIGLLEMSGYLARGAFLIDRLMRFLGLEGRAFIPLISSFACAIPGIMSARTLSSPRQRLITILMAPFITCSARLPVYALLISCFVPNTAIASVVGLQGFTLFGLFLAGVSAAVVVAWIFHKILPGQNSDAGFFMELPNYRLPTAKPLYHYVRLKVWSFIKKAGRIIFLLSLVLWCLAYFPRSQEIAQKYEGIRQGIAASQLTDENKKGQLQRLDQMEAGEFLRESFMGRMGRFIEPGLQPLGFDWKLGVGVIASFAAREVFVSTLGIVFNLGEADEESLSLRQSLQTAKKTDGTPAYTLRTALSLLIFFAFAAQCMPTLAVIRRETGSAKWAVAVFAYMTAIAYISAAVTYQGLGLFGLS